MSDDEDTVEQAEQPVTEPETTPKKRRAKKKPSSGVLTRLTQFEIMERRRQVGALRLRGLGLQQISKLLNVSTLTVQNDLKIVQAENAQRISAFDKEQYIGAGLAHFEEIRQRAWSEYYNANEVRYKLKALDLIRTIQKDEIDSLVATGVITKPKEEPAQVEHKHTLQLDWSPEMRQKATQALLQLSLKSNLAEPTPELPPIQEAQVVSETGTSHADEPEPPPQEE